ncbi:hypothetical protein UPYG_G00337620 [Umbra pygmaea]|uniref:G domain-containing protein n=1 Tax=Umbra pygmaea TaxID=75934 RepID=A0ABD0VWS5_UMBPY
MAKILLVGPVGAGKSSFFNSVNSLFRGNMTSQAICGSAGTSLTNQFRTFTLKSGKGGKPIPLILCDTMGLEDEPGAGLNIDDIVNINKGHIKDRYQAFHELVLLTKVDAACPLVAEDLQNLYSSHYIQRKVQEISVHLGVPVNSVLPVKNYNQEVDLDQNTDILLLSALDQMLNYADSFFENQLEDEKP